MNKIENFFFFIYFIHCSFILSFCAFANSGLKQKKPHQIK